MTNETYIRALSEITQANITLEAMKSANLERESQGKAPAYGEEQFSTLQQNLHERTLDLCNTYIPLTNGH